MSLNTLTTPKAYVTLDLGCGDVNDPRWGHLNVHYTQLRYQINPVTGATTVVPHTRTCYGPHGPEYEARCAVGEPCSVEFDVITPGSTYIQHTSAPGKCVAQ